MAKLAHTSLSLAHGLEDTGNLSDIPGDPRAGGNESPHFARVIAAPTTSDRIGVAHALADGNGAAGNEGDDRLGDKAFDEGGGILLVATADFAQQHDCLGFGIGIERSKRFAEVDTLDRVRADGDDSA